jgi:NAD(P)-dependent dehydrogenase (short-subunit alcohol dehydrogenase family)
MSPLRNRTVVVIGGSSGIGLAVASSVRNSGADVVIAGRSEQRLVEAQAALGDGVATRIVDGTDETHVKALFEDMEVVDHVFVSVGLVGGGGLLDADMAMHRGRLDSRVLAAAHAAKYGAPKMTRGGSITFCSGTVALRPGPATNPLSAASAAAVEGLARALAVQLAPIRVNTVVPGLVDTPLTAPTTEEQSRARTVFAQRLPVGRIGRPEEVAHAVCFLMENDYVTGTSLVVDGGGALV